MPIFILILLLIGLGSNPAAAADHVISQKDKKFSQDTIEVKLGDTILFKNEEKSISHNVYSLSALNEFELKMQKPGETTPIKIEKGKHIKGKMLIECAIHPSMKLWVTIKE